MRNRYVWAQQSTGGLLITELANSVMFLRDPSQIVVDRLGGVYLGDSQWMIRHGTYLFKFGREVYLSRTLILRHNAKLLDIPSLFCIWQLAISRSCSSHIPTSWVATQVHNSAIPTQSFPGRSTPSLESGPDLTHIITLTLNSSVSCLLPRSTQAWQSEVTTLSRQKDGQAISALNID